MVSEPRYRWIRRMPVWPHILDGALADYGLEKGTGPDESRRARAEADFQTRPALKLAPDNDEVKKLRAEVVKLLQLPE